MVRNGIFWTIGEQTYFVYYPIISYRKIKVYRVETMDMGRSHCNNGASGTILLGKFCQKNDLGGKCNRDKYYGTYFTRYDTLVRFLL